MLKTHSESSHCGVGFLVDLEGERCFDLLSSGLECLEKLEHRGGTGNHPLSGDGAGILTSIPYELFARDPETFALGQIFCHPDEKLWEQGLKKVTEVFNSYGLFIDEVREVETDRSALAPEAQDCAPKVRQLFIKRPIHCRTHSSFERLLYTAKQMVKCVLNQEGLSESLEFVSLSSRTVVYKVLGQSKQVRQFYKDLQNPQFKTSYVLFHRRFTTNSLSSWDKVQPFSLIAHNGEINAFQGNRSWAITREKALGLRKDELITHEGVSDTSNLNEMVEALRYRSSIPSEAEILSILIPPAVKNNDFYKFWARAVEPWDGPALVAYCSGKMIGARLDRNGFRPCRWMRTKKYFYLGSESGTFLPPDEVLESGALKAGESLKINLFNGKMYFEDPSLSQFNTGAEFDPRCNPLDYVSIEKLNKNVPRSFGFEATPRENWPLYGVHKELLTKLVFPMIEQGSEPVGSMGDTAKPAFLSDLNRNFYDYFYQRFAQVTNPPLDYLREKRVTDLTVFIGRKPNIFEPKELIPLKETIELSGPVLSLGQMEKIKTDEMYQDYRPAVISTLINPCETKEELLKQIDQLFDIALEKVRRGCQILILSDRGASPSKWIIPGLIAMKAVHQKLNQSGLRLRTSVVLDSGEIFTPHQLSVLIGFGATAVCPYLYLEMARLENLKKTDGMFPDEKEKRAIRAMEKGLLRVMAKMGISVLRSYQGAELFDVVGLGSDILDEFFPNRESIVGGLTFTGLIQNLKNQNQIGDLKNYFYFKESPKGTGEGHSITTKKTKEIHKWLKENDEDGLPWKEWENFGQNLRSLFKFKFSKNPSSADSALLEKEILKRFGSGAMSFGALSAESQRDLILAFKNVGGRANSGEGGENPYYFKEGISANVKQIASGRFGVTAEYLINSDEVQIKIAQGAKPGEGGQLPGHKVNTQIAKARFSKEGIGLISPPPMHDIYSIEDLKQLIYELKQFHPKAKVSVKLVSALTIGPIAVGVAKAGADVIQISGGDGGTGAASQLSMKHAGLPWEFGLWISHLALKESNLREVVKLRTDGGLQVGEDVAKAFLFGADEVDFGKSALIAQGCIMARVCHKNTCPAGIATQDEKFKARYKGNVSDVEKWLRRLAKETANILMNLNVQDLNQAIGNISFLQKAELPAHLKNLDLNFFSESSLKEPPPGLKAEIFWQHRKDQFLPNHLNQKIVDQFKEGEEFDSFYPINSLDRAVPGTLMGEIGKLQTKKRTDENVTLPEIKMNFIGHAGQGFGVFLSGNTKLNLKGFANDFVGKSMNDGEIVINPSLKGRDLFRLRSVAIGNCALYGATGGNLFVLGQAGDRFAVRNSGAETIIGGIGHHGCEYMTGGKVIVLDTVVANLGAGMSGGEIFIQRREGLKIHDGSVCVKALNNKDYEYLLSKLSLYERYFDINLGIEKLIPEFVKVVPK